MEHETGGDPLTGLKWSRRTTEKIAKALCKAGIQVGPKTVGRLLKELGYSLRVNHKKVESGNRNP
ncbi:MAG: ISAzo13-like element transposase-related protein, partial [Planctomycetota bacterium]